MNPVIASDLPYLIGVVALALTAFWAVGRAADRGAFAGERSRPVLQLIAAAAFGWLAASAIAERRWVSVVLFGAGSLFYLSLAWNARHRNRA